jgi:serine/threonine protein kinase
MFILEAEVEMYIVLQKKGTKEVYVLKGSPLRGGQEDPSDPNNKPISEIKQKFESLIVSWKKAMEKTEFIVKYVNHWYDDANNDSYILMEYCPGGDLRKEILKRKNQNKKFTEEVFNIY